MIQRHSPIFRKTVSPRVTTRAEYIPGQVILRVKEGAVQKSLGSSLLSFSGSPKKLLPESISKPLDYLRQNAGLKSISPLFSSRRDRVSSVTGAAMQRNQWAILSSVADSESEELRGITLATLDPKEATPSLLKTIKDSPGVDFIERMPARWLALSSADPMQNLQWGLRAIDWFQATIPDASDIHVGVLDTGIDEDHDDFKSVALTYFHKGLKSQDLLGHGTHVSGIIAASANNGVGISGIATCKLSVWKIFPDTPTMGEFYVDGERYLQALRALITENVRVANLSIGGTASSQTEAILFRQLHNRNITIVAAMGNEYQEGNPVEYPAAYDHVLSIGAIGENRKRAPFSNTGKHIDLVAPGANILSTLPQETSPYLSESEYASWSGTSMATPHVTAAAALVMAKHPGMDATQVKEHLRNTATKLPVMKGKTWSPSYGAGLLNLKNAL